MENRILILLLLLTTLPMTTPIPTSPTPSPSPAPPAPPQQLNNIIDALIGSGDFSNWVSILSMTNPTILPVSATLFIPEDTTLETNHLPMLDPFLFPYHIIPQRLTFSDLLLLPPNTRLPTLLPGKSISVTDNSVSNFSLDGTALTRPDIYATASIAVHGVAAVLDYTRFGNDTGAATAVDTPPTAYATVSPPPVGDTAAELGYRGDIAPAASCSDNVGVLLLVFCFLLCLVVKELFFCYIA